jgi:shikimate dehydrogenase
VSTDPDARLGDHAPRRAAVLGSPVAHSLSPVLHRAAYDALGLDWHYEAVECTADALAPFLRGLDQSWVGLSLTMPLKRAVLGLLDEATDLVRAVGAANTVIRTGGRLLGDNTDVPGIAAALGEGAVGSPSTATVLGGGATAASALAALAGLGLRRITVVVRSPARAAALQPVATALGVHIDLEDWPGQPSSWSTDVLIATVPAGASDDIATRPAGLPATPGLLLDVVYAPWPTRLADAAERAGSTVVGGLPMLVHQAAGQVELFTGAPAPVAVMRAAGEQALASRPS